MCCPKSLESCPILCDLTDCCPPSSSVHKDSPDKNTEVGCHTLLQRMLLTHGSHRQSCVSCTGRQALYNQYHLGSPDYNTHSNSFSQSLLFNFLSCFSLNIRFTLNCSEIYEYFLYGLCFVSALVKEIFSTHRS